MLHDLHAGFGLLFLKLVRVNDLFDGIITACHHVHLAKCLYAVGGHCVLMRVVHLPHIFVTDIGLSVNLISQVSFLTVGGSLLFFLNRLPVLGFDLFLGLPLGFCLFFHVLLQIADGFEVQLHALPDLGCAVHTLHRILVALLQILPCSIRINKRIRRIRQLLTFVHVIFQLFFGRLSLLRICHLLSQLF